MNPDITHKLIGPPGTGKTTELLRIAESLMESGYAPESICFVSFTRKAAYEARDRAMEKFKLNREQLPWFRTLHSLAMQQLGYSRGQVMGFADFINIARQLGLCITFKGASEDGNITGATKGDRLFFMECMARSQQCELKEYWERYPNEDVHYYELLRLRETMVAFKKATGKYDFTDMVTQFVQNPSVPNIKILIMDEAQDFTPLQWSMIEHLASEYVEEIYIAGDDDQAIFRWAGADVDRFIKLPGTERVLPQSYRVPVLIQEVAEEIAGRIQNRIPKHWLPTQEQGLVNYATAIDQIDMSEGTWLLLARNSYLLERYCAHCKQVGYVYDSALGSPTKGSTMKAIRAWETLRRGGKIKTPDVRIIYDLMTTKVGVAYGFKTKVDNMSDTEEHTLESLKKNYGLTTDLVWHQALDRIPPVEREYFIAAIRRGEKLLKEPRIKIETIHAIKGGEADNVVVCPDMADRTYQEFQQNPDDEHRVFYVAVTRAKKSLHILSPISNRYYPL